MKIRLCENARGLRISLVSRSRFPKVSEVSSRVPYTHILYQTHEFLLLKWHILRGNFYSIFGEIRMWDSTVNTHTTQVYSMNKSRTYPRRFGNILGYFCYMNVYLLKNLNIRAGHTYWEYSLGYSRDNLWISVRSLFFRDILRIL